MIFPNLKKSRCLVLIGRAGAGKDTVADTIFSLKGSPRPRPLKFSWPLKQMVAELFGWSPQMLDVLAYKEERLANPIKTLDYRNMWTRREVLQYVGTDVFRQMDENVWVNAALRRANGLANQFDTNGFICTDCRFPNELEAIKKHFGAVEVVKLIKRDNEAVSNHASETEIDKLDFDQVHSFLHGDLVGLRDLAMDLACFFPAEDKS